MVVWPLFVTRVVSGPLVLLMVDKTGCKRLGVGESQAVDLTPLTGLCFRCRFRAIAIERRLKVLPAAPAQSDSEQSLKRMRHSGPVKTGFRPGPPRAHDPIMPVLTTHYSSDTSSY